MLEKTYNEVVSFIQAMGADEFEQVLAPLPDAVKGGLADELKKFGDAHRHDIRANCAYYFQRHGDGTTIWTWNYVYRPHEAGELIFQVVSSTTTLDETLANECYARATGRTVDKPRPAMPEDEMAD
jgi:hypothetical protein